MYEHVLITDDAVWQQTHDSWMADANALGDEGVFLSRDAVSRLHTLRAQTENHDHIHCYFLLKNGCDSASAILEVSHACATSAKPWLKLLNITLRPSLLPKENWSAKEMKQAFEVVVYCITHSIRLIFNEHPSQELKIYGRTQEMINLFEGIVSTGQLDTVLEAIGLSVKIEGRWLVLFKNGERVTERSGENG